MLESSRGKKAIYLETEVATTATQHMTRREGEASQEDERTKKKNICGNSGRTPYS